MGTTGELELLGLLLCRRQREGGGRWWGKGEVLEGGRGRRWQEGAGEEEEERDRNKKDKTNMKASGPALGDSGVLSPNGPSTQAAGEPCW